MTLMEEATHLLRRTPVAAWLSYCVGTLPFTCYLYFFFCDMERSAQAAAHLPEASLLLALFYAWMKFWHAVYCDQLLGVLEERDQSEPLGFKAWARLAVCQAWIHGTMPIVLTLAGFAVIPFAWTYAFYHNVSTLAVENFRNGGNARSLISHALSQSHYRPAQNHVVGGILTLVMILVFGNLLMALFLGAKLLKMTTGMDNELTRHGSVIFAGSVQMLLATVTYLLLAPLPKAIYALRCFYGQARKSGEDLQARLRRLTRVPLALWVALLLTAFATLPSRGLAIEPPPSAPQGHQSAAAQQRSSELSHRLKDVLSESEYQWRFPKEGAGLAPEKGMINTSIDNFMEWLQRQWEKIAEYLHRLFGGDPKPEAPPKPGNLSSIGLVMSWAAKALAVLLALVLVAVIVRAIRQWRRENRPVEEEAPAAPAIDLESENVVASQLPENEWLQLAREKLEAGELRLALRAFFLATLARLGERKMLHITRGKSNGDYVRELGWRARGRQELLEPFSDQVRIFEHIWYGWHEVSTDLIKRFQEQHERILADA